MNTLLKKMLLTVITGSLLLFLSGCSLFGKAPEGVISMEEIIAQDKSPVEIISASAVMGVGNIALGTNPTLSITLKNISDKQIKMITWMMIYINSEGKLCAVPTEESGYADIYAIESGETVELEAFSSDPETSQVKIVIKDVTYVSEMNGYELNMLWENSHYSSDVDRIINEYNQ